jgi:flagellar assembly factor FliW
MEYVTVKSGTRVEPANIPYVFPQGLYGLEEYRTFILMVTDETSPFAYLQSVENEYIRLLLANPFVFYPDYEFELPAKDLTALETPKREHVSVWVTVSVRESFQTATINLLAPIVFNTEKRIGRQVVLHNSQYEIKAPLFTETKGEK